MGDLAPAGKEGIKPNAIYANTSPRHPYFLSYSKYTRRSATNPCNRVSCPSPHTTSSFAALGRLLKYARSYRRQIIAATACSIINKLFAEARWT